uniref:Uncharacterized protein n=1 Tax=Rhizophagus irregularis (strain DAOM 181602 / DAOM 197198 / MUCL 43194) TaxID=747089 RepID=U9SZC4_RHIID
MNREETQLRNPKWKILTCIISGHGTKIKAFQKTINLHRLQTWIYWYAERSLDPTTCAYKILSEIHEHVDGYGCRKNGVIYSHR